MRRNVMSDTGSAVSVIVSCQSSSVIRAARHVVIGHSAKKIGVGDLATVVSDRGQMRTFDQRPSWPGASISKALIFSPTWRT